jgi:hypothetical protein
LCQIAAIFLLFVWKGWLLHSVLVGVIHMGAARMMLPQLKPAVQPHFGCPVKPRRCQISLAGAEDRAVQSKSLADMPILHGRLNLAIHVVEHKVGPLRPQGSARWAAKHPCHQQRITSRQLPQGERAPPCLRAFPTSDGLLALLDSLQVASPLTTVLAFLKLQEALETRRGTRG